MVAVPLYFSRWIAAGSGVLVLFASWSPNLIIVEMESSEMYSNWKLNIPIRNCIGSSHSLYLCK